MLQLDDEEYEIEPGTRVCIDSAAIQGVDETPLTVEWPTVCVPCSNSNPDIDSNSDGSSDLGKF